MTRKMLLTTMALLACLWPLAAAGEVTPEAVMTRVQTQYDKAGGFQARFRQESRLKAAGASDSAVGWMYFKKPSRMRWQYETPPEQKKEIVSDGRLVWMYMPADGLVMVYKMDQVLRSDLVMRFFSGIGQFQKDFTVSWQRPPKGGRQLCHRPGAQKGPAGAQAPHPDHQPRHLPGGEAGFQQCPGRGEPLHLYPGEAGSALGARLLHLYAAAGSPGGPGDPGL